MERYKINPINPHSRYILKASDVLSSGEIVAYPTDINYGFGCVLSSSHGVKNLNSLAARFARGKLHTIICRDFSEISKYASVPNDVFRFMKKLLPGAYTLILEATTLVPKVCQTRRKTIGVRIVDHPVVQSLLSQIDSPLLNVTALPAREDRLIEDPDEIVELYKNNISAFLDIGRIPSRYTTVIDFTGGYPVLLRKGAGSVDFEVY